MLLSIDPPNLKAATIPGVQQGKLFPIEAQVIRSCSEWSVGYDSAIDSWSENSIHQAYVHEILDAEHFVYIENQYFISSTGNESIDEDHDGSIDAGEQLSADISDAFGTDIIQNRISEAIALRVERAIKHKQGFKVVMVIPNFPEGAVTDITIQAILHFQLMTLVGVEHPIKAIENSLTKAKSKNDSEKIRELEDSLKKIKKEGIKKELARFGSLVSRIKYACEQADHLNNDPDRWRDYLSINSLRKYQIFPAVEEQDLPERAIMNQIYVHAKLLIVDDRTVLCGSANVNDRSQLGMRDSEVPTQCTTLGRHQLLYAGCRWTCE